MKTKNELEREVLRAAAENGVSAVLFRNAIGRKLGLNVTDSECLSLLSARGTSTPTELARYTGLSSGATTAMIDRLERSGFAQRTPNKADRRGVLVAVTPTWGETVGPFVGGVQRAHAGLIAGYSESELATIADFLRRFTQNVNEQAAVIESCAPPRSRTQRRRSSQG